MKSIKFCFLFLLFIFFTNCSKDETPNNQTEPDETTNPDESNEEVYFSYTITDDLFSQLPF